MFYQLNAPQRFFSPDLIRFFNDFPKTLDETYERILKGINEAQKDNAHRLLQCLTVASRPLRVEEIAELLKFDFRASSSGGDPKLENWRWDGHEEAVLSTCSGLIAIVRSGDSRVIQISNFIVEEYLTSPRIAWSPCVDVSRFHIDLESAHTIMAQACLATLLRSDKHDEKGNAKRSPLDKYAAQYWVEHAQFEKVSSRVRDRMEDLFDNSKPHFSAWLQVHDMDGEAWATFSMNKEHHGGSPLYYAALCGFYNLAERLIMKHPDQVNARGGRILAPLPAALYKKHLLVANLLYRNGAVVDVRDSNKETPLLAATVNGEGEIMRWLLDHGADANAGNVVSRTPLHYAASLLYPEAIQVLFEHGVDINSQSVAGETPLYEVSSRANVEGRIVDVVRRLLEHGADPNICNILNSTPLHEASERGYPEVARLLISYGAKIHGKDGQGNSSF